jgi:hypothetical protein
MRTTKSKTRASFTGSGLAEKEDERRILLYGGPSRTRANDKSPKLGFRQDHFVCRLSPACRDLHQAGGPSRRLHQLFAISTHAHQMMSKHVARFS